MSGLGFSWDWEKALEIANSGAESLEGLNKRLTGLQDEVAVLVTVEHETQKALTLVADGLPTALPGLKTEALIRCRRLDQLHGRVEGAADTASEAIAGFRANLADIERLHHEMTRT
jgi:hypothetical protein